jgi:Tol biopolymer transport system component
MEAHQPIVAGSRFGPYEILSPMGEGGMGEVYRARDERLDRIVALKILAPDRSSDPEFRDRLRREARALSRLSHPNVCAIFDVGTAGGRDYFVMELLAGETLADRLQRGPLSLEQTLDVAIQIASALDTSHRAGLVHRDLKPANVMLTPSGVKLLDFGIARFAPLGSAALHATATATVTPHDAFSGTLQYMSPEQLEGKEADARSDIFSFGALLYEMITGRRAFGGESPARVTASILTDDPPPMLSLQPSAPREVDRLIRSCLAKNPADRWQSAHDLRLELGWLADRVRVPASDTGRRSGYRPLWIAAGVLGALAAGLLIAALLTRRSPDRPAVRAMILPPQGAQFTPVGTQGGPAVLSPDGRRLAFAASGADGRPRLWVQSLDSPVAQPLTGTDNGAFPFWSPDGGQLGFFADTKLKRIDIANGTVSTVCDARGSGGTWNRDGTIVFAPSFNTGLYRVSAGGGSPTPVTTLDEQRRDRTHRWPAFLPNGRRFIFAAQKEGGGPWTIRVGSLDSNRIDDVMEANSNALYAGGALIFVRNGTLLAQRVDERTLRAAGQPVPLAENVVHDVFLGRAVFSASEHGLLVYQTGSAVLPSRLVWLDRTGTNVGVIDEACFCSWPSLAPDGQKAAIAATHPATGNSDIHVYHLGDGQKQSLTFDETHEGHPAWTPDSKRIVLTSTRRGFRDIYWTDALGAGPQEVLFASDRDKYVHAVTANGVVFSQDGDFWVLPLTRGAKPQEFRVSERNELFGQVSPSGRWFVYQSNEETKPEVFVTSFPERKGKWPISEDGGMLPRWSHDGREIFYLKQDHSTMFAAAVGQEAGSIRVLRRDRLFTVPMLLGRGWPYDVSRDGRFLAIASSGSTTAPLTLVVDWTGEVR